MDSNEEEGWAERRADADIADALPTGEAPYIFEFIPKRLYCGAFPSVRVNAHYLTRTLGVTHIVNMMGDTHGSVTKSGKPSDTWYECHWDRFKPRNQPEIVRAYKLPDAHRTMNDATPLYAECARNVVLPLLKAGHIVYVHCNTGLDHEAQVALLAWAMYDPTTAPGGGGGGGVGRWLAARNYENLIDRPEKRALLDTALLALQARAKKDAAPGSMASFVTKRQRIKK